MAALRNDADLIPLGGVVITSAFESTLTAINLGLESKKDFRYDRVIEATTKKDENRIPIATFRRRMIGLISTLCVLQLCSSLLDDIAIDSFWSRLIISLFEINAYGLQTSRTFRGSYQMSLPKNILSRKFGSIILQVILKIFPDARFDHASFQRMIGRCGEITDSDVADQADILRIMDEEFYKIWGCKIDFIVCNALCRRGFLKFMNQLFTPQACGRFSVESTLAMPMEKEAKMEYMMYLDGYDKMECRCRFEYWIKNIKKLKIFETTWVFIRDSLVSAIEEVRNSGITNKIYQVADARQVADGIFIYTSPINCFKAVENRLTWDDGDCLVVQNALEKVLAGNVPCEDAKWQTAMKSFRDKICTILRSISIAILNDKEEKREIIFTKRTNDEVKTIKDNLQMILVGNILTPSGKHLTKKCTDAIELLYDTFGHDILNGLVEYHTHEVPNTNFQKSKCSLFGMWELVVEFTYNKKAEDAPLLSLLKRIYFDTKEQGGYIMIKHNEKEKENFLSGEYIIQHAICDQSVRLDSGIVDIQDVANELNKIRSVVGDSWMDTY